MIAGLAASVLATPSLAAEGIAVISRDRVLNEVAASRALRVAEADVTRRLQSIIDAAQNALSDEEAELARLRAELPTAEFEARAADFDQRLRLMRRAAQERVGIVNAGFQNARAQIVGALPQILERLRIEAGVTLIVNADQVLALDAASDLTDRAIALYNAVGPRPAPPDVDLDTPLMPPPDVETPARE